MRRRSLEDAPKMQKKKDRRRPGRGGAPRQDPDPRPEDRPRFEQLKSEIREDVRHLKDMPALIVQLGRRLKEVQDHGLYKLDGARTWNQWVKAEYGFWANQAWRYMQCFVELSGVDLKGLHLGVNHMMVLREAQGLREVLIDAAHEFDYTEEALRNALYAGQAKQAEGGSEVEIRQAMVLYGRLGKGVVRLTRPGKKKGTGLEVLMKAALRQVTKVPGMLAQMKMMGLQGQAATESEVSSLLGVLAESLRQAADLSRRWMEEDEIRDLVSSLLGWGSSGGDGPGGGGGGGRGGGEEAEEGEGEGGEGEGEGGEGEGEGGEGEGEGGEGGEEVVEQVAAAGNGEGAAPAEVSASAALEDEAPDLGDLGPEEYESYSIEGEIDEPDLPLPGAQPCEQRAAAIDAGPAPAAEVRAPAAEVRAPAAEVRAPAAEVRAPAAEVSGPDPQAAEDVRLPSELRELLELPPPAPPAPFPQQELQQYTQAMRKAEERTQSEAYETGRAAYESKVRADLTELGCTELDIQYHLRHFPYRFIPAGAISLPQAPEIPLITVDLSLPENQIARVPGWALPDDGQEYQPLLPVPGPLPPLPADWGQITDYRAPIFRPSAIAGAAQMPAQSGVFGTRYGTGDPVLISTDDTLGMLFFGVPSSGKTYGAHSLSELGLFGNQLLCTLKQPHCVIHLPYPNAGYAPEILAGVRRNEVPSETKKLVEVYRVVPQGLPDMVVLTPSERVAEMRRQELHAQVHGIKFSLQDLGGQGLMLLLGIDAMRSPLYAKQVMGMIKGLRRRLGGQPLTWRELIREVGRYGFDPAVRRLLYCRLRLVRPWIDDRQSIVRHIKAGRTLVVDIRDEWLSTELAFLLYALVTHALVTSSLREQHGITVPLMVIWDEAHKSARHPVVRGQIITAFRERRHLRLRPILVSQDPAPLPGEVVPLADVVGVYEHDSQEWNRCLGKAIWDLRVLDAKMTRNLPPGFMLMWARNWVMLDPAYGDFHHMLHLMEVRPRLSQHGGHTKRAV